MTELDVDHSDYYNILGVSPQATVAQVRAAHRSLVRQYHPDTAEDGLGDPCQFSNIQLAYEILSQADARRRYDRKRAAIHGDTTKPGIRRPPKAPCRVCGVPVYASQLTLYLGRHMCKTCFDAKSDRHASRKVFTGAAEFRWKLLQWRIWAQAHRPAIALIVISFAAMGARLIWAVGQNHDHRSLTPIAHARPDSSAYQSTAPRKSDASDVLTTTREPQDEPQ